MRDSTEDVLADFGLVSDLLGTECPYVFPTEQDVLQLHMLAVSRGGGRFGLRDRGLLVSALHRPMQIMAYEGEVVSPGLLAGSLCAGIVQNHPFVDGNKRTGFLASVMFLRRSKLDLRTRDPAYWHALVVRFAAHEMEEQALVELFNGQVIEMAVGPIAPLQEDAHVASGLRP